MTNLEKCARMVSFARDKRLGSCWGVAFTSPNSAVHRPICPISEQMMYGIHTLTDY